MTKPKSKPDRVPIFVGHVDEYHEFVDDALARNSQRKKTKPVIRSGQKRTTPAKRVKRR